MIRGMLPIGIDRCRFKDLVDLSQDLLRVVAAVYCNDDIAYLVYAFKRLTPMCTDSKLFLCYNLAAPSLRVF